MVVDVTTAARVKAALNISDSSEDTWIGLAITAVSQRFELFMGRPILIAERTEEYDVHNGRQMSLFLRAHPVSSITSIKNSVAWNFDTTTALSSELYRLNASTGEVHMGVELAAGPKAIQVVYTAGMAADTAGLISAYPTIAMAGDLQVTAMFRRRKSPAGSSLSGKLQGSVSFEGQLKLLTEVSETLTSYRRLRFGV